MVVPVDHLVTRDLRAVHQNVGDQNGRDAQQQQNFRQNQNKTFNGIHGSFDCAT